MILPELALAVQLSITGVPSEQEVRKYHNPAKRKYLQRTFVQEPDITSSAATLADATTSANKAVGVEIWDEAKKSGIGALLSDLGALLKDNEDYSEEFLPPSHSATQKAWELLSKAGSILVESFPYGTIYPDGEGGIRIEWIRARHELRVSIPGTTAGKGYIYHEVGSKYGVDHNLSPNNLCNWLNWLKTNDTTTESSRRDLGKPTV